MWKNFSFVRNKVRFTQLTRFRNIGHRNPLSVTQPLVIYEAPIKDVSYYKRIGYLCMGLTFVSGVLSYNSWKLYRSLTEQASKWVKRFSLFVPFATCIPGIFALGFGAIYPNRIVRAVTLLPQSRAVFNFYGIFGRYSDSAMLVNINDMDVVNVKEGNIYCTIAGRPFKFVLNCTNAKFPSPDHFNNVFTMNKKF